MITNLKYTTIALITSLSLCACVPTQDIYRGLTRQPVSLAYLYDTSPASQQSELTVSINPIVTAPLHATGHLKKTQSSLLPLLVYNQWKGELVYTLGQASVQEDLASFVKDSWQTESYRSGLYQPMSETNADFSLEVTVDSLYARGPYRVDGFFLFALLAWSYSQQEHAGPGIAYARFTYRLKKGTEVLWEKVTESKQSSQMLNSQVKTVQKLRDDYTTHLAESLSLALKENITQMVRQVNQYLRSHHAKTIRTRPVAEQQARLQRASETAPIPQAKVVIYRRNKKQRDEAVMITLADSTLVNLYPNQYQELILAPKGVQLCAGASCITVTPSTQRTTYLECSFTPKAKQASLETVKSKVGVFYVKEIGHKQAKR